MCPLEPIEPDIEELEGLAELVYPRRLFLCLKKQHDSGNKEVTIKDIKADMRISYFTIVKYADLLAESRIITIKRRRGPKSNIYQINSDSQYTKIVDKFTELVSEYGDV